jgi:hypothetical protein
MPFNGMLGGLREWAWQLRFLRGQRNRTIEDATTELRSLVAHPNGCHLGTPINATGMPRPGTASSDPNRTRTTRSRGSSWSATPKGSSTTQCDQPSPPLFPTTNGAFKRSMRHAAFSRYNRTESKACQRVRKGPDGGR